MRLYHTGFLTITKPDVHYGRKNADFGQGFYLSDDEEFSKRWAKRRKGSDTILNTYELDTDGLRVKRFVRDVEWFDYLYHNRAGYADSLSEYDVIIGPIANDTIFDTWGVITSGLLPQELALELLQLGGEYHQIVLKTKKAVSQLRFIGSRVIPPDEVALYRETVIREEQEYQRLFADRLSREPDFSDIT
ncbi:MAG: DUF3990 domain-containing protein [Ruminococcus sp.]|nr:DUF3990 domain-containing protein [Ruminococcus sp.]